MSISPKHFELILVDVQTELCEAWINSFKNLPRVTVYNGKFQEITEFDCIVSPANSFGLMDGGIDLLIRNFFGMQVQKNVQKIIKKEFYGEQPVGTSIIVDTENDDHPFLAHTPTMRVPRDISNTDNVYNAAFAMFRAIANHNKNDRTRINKVLCPGLGTATGRVKPKEAARQMALAYKNFLEPTTNLIWSNLIARNNEIMDVDK
jgi:O-acetyl-ADP-ribose deacetylase (regulator of RNase III)